MLAKCDTTSLAINVLMSFGAVAMAARIIALQPAFTTGAALGVVLVAIGLLVLRRLDNRFGGRLRSLVPAAESRR